MGSKFNLILRSKDAAVRTPDVFSGATWDLPSNLELQRFDRVRLAWCSSVYGMYDTDLGTPLSWGWNACSLLRRGATTRPSRGPHGCWGGW